MSQPVPTDTYLFLFRNCSSERWSSPEEMQQVLDKWMAWIRSMKAQGQYVDGNPLEEAPAKVLQEPRGAKVTDGPFAEAKEVVAGYMLVHARDLDHALEIARGCPGLEYGASVEVRQTAALPM